MRKQMTINNPALKRWALSGWAAGIGDPGYN
jgi:hypothetical protein